MMGAYRYNNNNIAHTAHSFACVHEGCRLSTWNGAEGGSPLFNVHATHTVHARTQTGARTTTTNKAPRGPHLPKGETYTYPRHSIQSLQIARGGKRGGNVTLDCN